jgi:RNA 2',3'-cyclic 3'-phosphodiesterase
MGTGTDRGTEEATEGASSGRPAVETARVFFALWPGDSARAVLAHAIRKAARSCGGRPVPEHNLHATLVFIGSVAVSRLPELRILAADVASAQVVAPFELTFDRVEYWPKPHVLVATAGATAGVVSAGALARALLEAMQRAGFDPDSKPFRPHITIARKVGKMTQVPEIHPIRLAFNSFALVASRTLPEGPVYSVVESFVLEPEAD